MPRPFRQQNANYTSVGQAWKSWPSVSVTLYNLPNKITTRALWKAFQMQGNLVSIDIFEDKHGSPISKGRIRFRYVSFLFLSYLDSLLCGSPAVEVVWALFWVC
jgi:hypothetical protein